MLIKCGDKEKIIQKVEKIREMIEKHAFKTIGHITTSFGITISHDNDSTEALLKRADEALYRAKKMGKNRVVAN
jgi:diguanylate cyclase (GGDEF)-like protein